MKHLVKLSIVEPYSSRSVIFRAHGQAEDYLKDSGLPFTILRGNSFMQNLTVVLSRKITYQPISFEEWEKVIATWGVEPWFVKAVREAWRPDWEGHYSVLSNTVSDITGRNPIPMEQFLRDYLPVFQAVSQFRQKNAFFYQELGNSGTTIARGMSGTTSPM